MRDEGPIQADPQTDETASAAKIGEQLRRARESKGVSLGDVARDIRLDARHLQALEAAAFDRIPGAVFVRGYLRAYARHLGLDPEPLVSAYDRTPHAPEPPLVSVGRKRSFTQALDWIPWSKLLNGALAVAGVVAAIWLASLLYGMFAPGSPPAGTGDDGATTDGSTLELPLPPASSSSEAQSRSWPEASVLAPPAGDDLPATHVSVDEPVVNGPADEAAEAVQAQVPEQPAPSATLTLTFSQDSWAEVYDAADQRLMSKIGKAGETHALRGTPPFSVVLGFAPGVAVAYNGQPIEVRTRGQVARLNVGDNGP